MRRKFRELNTNYSTSMLVELQQNVEKIERGERRMCVHRRDPLVG